MNTITKIKISITIVLIAMAISSCGGDPFHLNYRKIAGTFYLLRWEDNKTYYIVQEKHLNDQEIGGGALSGTVLQIGWNKKFIVAKRYATFRGDKDGWMIIDLTTNKMVGPISDTDESSRFPKLKLMQPSAAWESLK